MLPLLLACVSRFGSPDATPTPDSVTVVTDNLGTGMAGTAVQNLNLVAGLDETTGLRFPGMGL